MASTPKLAPLVPAPISDLTSINFIGLIIIMYYLSNLIK